MPNISQKEKVPRIAVVGTGYWGRNLVRVFHELGALAVVCDTNPIKLDHLHQEYEGIKVEQNFDSLLQSPELTGVVIATPAELHYDMVRRALLANRDVFVEKPLALTTPEGEELVRLADERSRILMVGHVLLYHPAILKLKELVDQGVLGRIQYIYSNRLNLGKIRREENILWSFAPHDISVILMLLGELPKEVSAHGGCYLQSRIYDATMSTLAFDSGVQVHLFVSWLHPFKEQKLVVVGDRQMAVFDDVEDGAKLRLYPHQIEWLERVPVPHKAEARFVSVRKEEPLKEECRAFLEALTSRKDPRSGGRRGLQVLSVLDACQHSLESGGQVVSLGAKRQSLPYFVHPTSTIDQQCEIGEGSKIWHYSHIMSGARIGKDCSLGQNVFVGRNVVIGNKVKIQNNVSVYEGVELEDNVFCGPSMVFTNVINPRSEIERKEEFRHTLVYRGATLGANCVILCGRTIGRYAFVGSGAVVTKDVPDYSLVVGNPGRIVGWMCRCGKKLAFNPVDVDEAQQEETQCQSCGARYVKGGEVVKEMPAREGLSY